MAKEYMLAHLLEEPRQENDIFKSWPAHITVLPWFVCKDLVVIEDALHEACDQIEPIVVQTGPMLMLGPKHDKPARQVGKTPKLQRMHLDILDVISNPDNGARIQNKIEYFGNAYNPHITKHARFDEGQPVIIDQISLVSASEIEPNNHRLKVIERTFKLGLGHEATA
ncbi:MAG: 2'-5' RNA ligase family protein [Candidatus Saccharimonadales bacterium]